MSNVARGCRALGVFTSAWVAFGGGPASSESPSAAVAAAASQFVATLDATQRAKLQLPFDSEARFAWFYVPRERDGLPLKKMTAVQQQAALRVVEAGLSQKGYSKAEAVRALEPVLAEIERNPTRRDPDLYYLTIFGEPSAAGTWGMRWEGHHLSLNWTFVNGTAAATTPQFFGSNPAEVREGPKKGTRVLHAEEDLARALLASLTDAQRRIAIVSATAPDDILTTNTRQAAIQADSGLAYDEMTSEQQGMLLAIVDEYASVQPRALAAERITRLRAAGVGRIKFAWMGATDKDAPHYYRVQGPTFLIELDNTQNNANHIHSVWRDFAGDFGADLLEAHYKHSPHHHGAPR